MAVNLEEQMTIRLKVVDGEVRAFGDDYGCREEDADLVVSMVEWAAAGSCARLNEHGQIVLGKGSEAMIESWGEKIRWERYLRLRACDKISPMRWNAMSEEEKTAWTDYRQDLLDIPQLPGFPWGGDLSRVPWPTSPDE